MIKTSFLAATAALTLLCAGAAAAQDGRPRARVDANGDRRVTFAEMQAGATQRFARQDTNRDGRLTADERRAGRQAVRAQRAQQRGGSGRAARVLPAFAQLDADRDGRLTMQEYDAARAVMAAGRGSRPDRAARGGRGGDADGDGAITRAELDVRLRARFSQMDMNRDGFVTPDERRARRQQRRG